MSAPSRAGGAALFGREFDTLEAAQQSLAPIGFFCTYGVLETPSGKYVTADLRLKEWSRDELHDFRAQLLRITGNTLVSYTNPFFGWSGLPR